MLIIRACALISEVIVIIVIVIVLLLYAAAVAFIIEIGRITSFIWRYGNRIFMQKCYWLLKLICVGSLNRIVGGLVNVMMGSWFNHALMFWFYLKKNHIDMKLFQGKQFEISLVLKSVFSQMLYRFHLSMITTHIVFDRWLITQFLKYIKKNLDWKNIFLY